MADKVNSYYNNWMDITFNCYYLNNPDDTGNPMLLSDWLSEIYRVYGHVGVFQLATTINVWNPARSDCPEIKSYAGLTYWDGHIDINYVYYGKGVLSHEFGHWVSMGTRMCPEGDDHGRRMWQLYVNLRGKDFTSRTPAAERWAEDFKTFFGCDGVRDRLDPNDDHYVIGTRSAFAVVGLKTFVKDFKYVLDYWRQVGSYSSETYVADGGYWVWYKTSWWSSRWEAFRDNTFYYWTGKEWLPFKTV